MAKEKIPTQEELLELAGIEGSYSIFSELNENDNHNKIKYQAGDISNPTLTDKPVVDDRANFQPKLINELEKKRIIELARKGMSYQPLKEMIDDEDLYDDDRKHPDHFTYRRQKKERKLDVDSYLPEHIKNVTRRGRLGYDELGLRVREREREKIRNSFCKHDFMVERQLDDGVEIKCKLCSITNELSSQEFIEWVQNKNENCK